LHEFGAATNIGARDNNEDSFVCDADRKRWRVADGMGGHGFGEVASAISTYAVTSQIRDGHGVNQAIELAHNRIKEFAEADAKGSNMGTTIVLLLSRGSLYNVFWVGDSRGYLYDGKLSQITHDHSVLQSLIDQGELTEEQAEFDPRKHGITRALGAPLESVRADSISDKWKANQKILLCSDGLSDSVRSEDIEKILQEGGTDQEIVERLIAKALAEGGKDNITVVLVSAPHSVDKPDSDTDVPDDTTGWNRNSNGMRAYDPDTITRVVPKSIANK